MAVVLAELLDNTLDTLVKLGRDFEGCVRVDIEPTLGLSKVHLVVEEAADYFLVLIRLEPLDALPFLPEAELG